MKKPPYQIETYQEMCCPCQTVRIRGEEKIVPLEEEIIEAIKDEPTVRLSRLHIEQLLKQYAGFDDAEYRRLMELAKQNDRY